MRPIGALFTLTWRVSSAILEPSSAQTNNALIENSSFKKNYYVYLIMVDLMSYLPP